MKVEFTNDHDNPTNCQLVVCITGDSDAILAKLGEIQEQIVSKYGKPYQGTTLSWGGVCSVVTPVWNGKKY